MKKSIVLLLFFNYCCGMQNTPGIARHPYWPNEIYEAGAKDCFDHLKELKDKQIHIKNFLKERQMEWQEGLDNSITNHHVGNKLISKEDFLLNICATFFFTKWDSPEPFVTHPLTDHAHLNTALLRVFFKDFTQRSYGLYLYARNKIIQERNANYKYDGNEEHPLIVQLYPTNTERIQALLKEASALNAALLARL